MDATYWKDSLQEIQDTSDLPERREAAPPPEQQPEAALEDAEPPKTEPSPTTHKATSTGLLDSEPPTEDYLPPPTPLPPDLNHPPLYIQEAMGRLASPEPWQAEWSSLQARYQALKQSKMREYRQRSLERIEQYHTMLQGIEALQDELEWLAPNHPMVEEAQALEQHLHNELELLEGFEAWLQTCPSQQPLEERQLRSPAHPILTPLPATVSLEPSPPPPAAKEDTTEQDNEPPPHEALAEPPQQPNEATAQEEISPDVSASIEESEQPRQASTSQGSMYTVESLTVAAHLGYTELLHTVQREDSHTVERLVERIQLGLDSPSLRCAANELEQALPKLSNSLWEKLAVLVSLRFVFRDVSISHLSKFSHLHRVAELLLQRVGVAQLKKLGRPQPSEVLATEAPVVEQTEEPNLPLDESDDQDAEEGWSQRMQERLPSDLAAHLRTVEARLFGAQSQEVAYLEPEEAALALESTGALARWVQEHLPKEERLAPAVRRWFGVLGKLRVKHCNEHWLDSLNRGHQPKEGWLEVHRQNESKRESLREEERRELQAAQEALEQQRRSRQENRQTLRHLSNIASTLSPDLPQESEERQRFITKVKTFLQSDLAVPSHPELLTMLQPLEPWFAQGKCFRHLRKHLRKANEVDLPEAESQELPFEEDDLAEEPAVAKAPNATQLLLRQILPEVRGSRALIIGGDIREAKRQRLEQRLQLKSLTWIPSEEGSVRKIGSAVRSIESGQLDMLILLLSFCGHSKVHSLIQAAKRHDVFWVPVDHGHGEVRIIHRIAYYLGFLNSSDT
ncbi:MAG: hypothetical protein EP343_18120 [Deltaproteobacteria bacterium]|nr:MAG: hypothetical protein EP343_18120 [Deltaproteobacteria bacterium]